MATEETTTDVEQTDVGDAEFGHGVAIPTLSTSVGSDRHPTGADAAVMKGLVQDACASSNIEWLVVSGMGGIGKSYAVQHAVLSMPEATPSGTFWLDASSTNALVSSVRSTMLRIPSLCDMVTSKAKDAFLFQAFHNWLNQKDRRGWLLVFDNCDQMDIISTTDLRNSVDELNLAVTSLIPQSTNGNGGCVVLTTRYGAGKIRNAISQHVAIDQITCHSSCLLSQEESQALLLSEGCTQGDSVAEEEMGAVRELSELTNGLPLALVAISKLVRSKFSSFRDYNAARRAVMNDDGATTSSIVMGAWTVAQWVDDSFSAKSETWRRKLVAKLEEAHCETFQDIIAAKDFDDVFEVAEQLNPVKEAVTSSQNAFETSLSNCLSTIFSLTYNQLSQDTQELFDLLCYTQHDNISLNFMQTLLSTSQSQTTCGDDGETNEEAGENSDGDVNEAKETAVQTEAGHGETEEPECVGMSTEDRLAELAEVSLVSWNAERKCASLHRLVQATQVKLHERSGLQESRNRYFEIFVRALNTFATGIAALSSNPTELANANETAGDNKFVLDLLAHSSRVEDTVRYVQTQREDCNDLISISKKKKGKKGKNKQKKKTKGQRNGGTLAMRWCEFSERCCEDCYQLFELKYTTFGDHSDIIESTCRAALDLVQLSSIHSENPDQSYSWNGRMAQCLRGNGRHDEALAHCRVQKRVVEQSFPNDVQRRCKALQLHGITLANMGNMAEAEVCYQDALERLRESFPEERRDICKCMMNLGTVRQGQGKLDEAEEPLRDALRGLQEALPQNHPEVINCLMVVGNVYRDQNKSAEAEVCYRDALVGLRSCLGETHPDTAWCMMNLANVQRAQGKMAEAEVCYRDALVGLRAALPENHPGICKCMMNLGLVHHQQGNLSKAEQYLCDALVGMRASLPENHPNIANSMMNLGFVYADQGKLAEAEVCYRDALVGLQAAYPENHPDICKCMMNLGTVRQGQGKLDEAEVTLRDAVVGLRAALPENHPTTARCMMNLGSVYCAQGKSAEAEMCLRDSLVGLKKALPENHPTISKCMMNLGSAYCDQGKLDDAEKSLRDSLVGLKASLPEHHPDTARCTMNLGLVHRAQGKLDEAEECLLEALVGLRAALPENHPSIEKCAASLELVQKDQEQHSESNLD